MAGTRRSKRARATFAISAALIAIAALTTVPTSAGAATRVVGGGAVQCTATGAVKFAPPLTTTVKTKSKMTVKAALTCSTGTTGNPAVTVVSAKLVVHTAPATLSCTAPTYGTGFGPVSYKATGGSVAPSKVSWPTVSVTDGTNVTIDLKGEPSIGSYLGEDVTMHIVGPDTLGGLCGTATKGFKFTGGTFDVASPNPLGLPVQHVIVMMQENRSADTYLSSLSTQGQPDYEAEPTTGNPDPTNPSGPAIVPFHKTSYCEVDDLDHSWTGTHNEVDGGAMDGFTAQNVTANDPTGSRTMGYYDQSDLPYYYGLSNTFATGDRYFSSVLSQTYPNRLYLLAGTSFGHIRNDVANSTQKSVFELLDARSITWKIYASQYPTAYGSTFFKYVRDRASTHVFPMTRYFSDVANNQLPQVTFIDPMFFGSPKTENDEHPPSDVQIGQKFVADAANALMASPEWTTSALFLTWDEHGGFYDHVVPPAAPKPDNIAPMLQPGDTSAAFDQYGIRVPAIVISPFSKSHFVSHVVHDHTSILKFIETRFGLPSLTNRDAAADPMLEMFDFTNPAFTTPPSLPTAVVDQAKLNAC